MKRCIRVVLSTVKIIIGIMFIVTAFALVFPDNITMSQGKKFATSTLIETADSNEQKIISLINAYRKENDKPTLKENELLMQSSKCRTEEMQRTDKFEHESLNGESFSNAIDKVGYKYALIAENIARLSNCINSEIAEKTFEGWKNSDSHNKTMLEKTYSEIGVSVCDNAKQVYVVLHVGNPTQYYSVEKIILEDDIICEK